MCSYSAGLLGSEVRLCAEQYARSRGLAFEVAAGSTASILFKPGELSHGNFFPASYRAIVGNPAWARRLTKAHTAYRRSRALAGWAWRELDCAVSSDALLMNIFCAAGVQESPAVAALLGTGVGTKLSFGYKPRVPLANGRFDATEVDLARGSADSLLLVEAKLTETGFQTARAALVERFRDLAEIFDLDGLPRTVAQPTGRLIWNAAEERAEEQMRGTAGHYLHYQLIRGVLAAHAHGASYCVLLDARRQDLKQAWLQIIQAVKLPALRPRLQLLTWQELAAALPCELQSWLAHKYGIVAVSSNLRF